jgi:hypothetical protein
MARSNTRRAQTLRVVAQPHRSGPAPAPESPRSRFKRIAPDRLGKVVKAIDHLKQLANTAVYDARPTEKQQLVELIKEKADELAYVLEHPGKAPPILQFEDEDQAIG